MPILLAFGEKGGGLHLGSHATQTGLDAVPDTTADTFLDLEKNSIVCSLLVYEKNHSFAVGFARVLIEQCKFSSRLNASKLKNKLFR